MSGSGYTGSNSNSNTPPNLSRGTSSSSTVSWESSVSSRTNGQGGGPDSSAAERPLPDGFVPGPSHVICARGKSQWDHEGNRRYRGIIAAAAHRYANATSKIDKSLIVSKIIDAVERPFAAFVKKRKDGTWVQCNEHFVREKVTQSLRDSLHAKYKSSTKAKKKRRTQFSVKMSGDADRVIRSNPLVSQRIQRLSRDLQLTASDYTICNMLSRANSDILESIKMDTDLLVKFENARKAAKKSNNS